MADSTLEAAAAAVLRLARQQGSITARDIRTETKLAGLPEARWRDVAALVKPTLTLRRGRYTPVESTSPSRSAADEQRDRIAQALRQLLRQHRASTRKRERRGEDRVTYLQPVKVRTSDGKTLNLLCRDLSTTGIRFLSTRQHLGQKVIVEILDPKSSQPLEFTVRILWTCAVGDDLFENGGTFLEIVGAGTSK